MKLLPSKDHGTLFDAYGKEIEFCREADTETGECLCCEHDEQGKYKRDASGGILLLRKRFRSPLRFVPALNSRVRD